MGKSFGTENSPERYAQHMYPDCYSVASHQSENHAGACETRDGDFIIDRHRIIYAGREKNKE